MIRINHQFLSYIEVLFLEGNTTIEQLEAPAHTIILEQQKTVHAVYAIQKGLSKCYQTEDTGTDFVQEFFGPGELFGEIEMFNNDISFCTIETITAVTYYKIPKDLFTKLTLQNEEFNSFVINSLAKKIKYTALRHSYNQTHPIEQKIMRLKDQFPELFDFISKKDIANYLGITIRSLNRSLSQMNI